MFLTVKVSSNGSPIMNDPCGDFTDDAQLASEQPRPDVRDREQQDEDIRQRVRKMDPSDPGEEGQDRDTRDQRYPRSHDAPPVRTAIAVTPDAGPSSALTRLPGSPRAPLPL